jgi:Glycosyl transferases group 1
MPNNNPFRKNVLFITHAFPPGSSSAVFRPLKFVKFLPDFGWRPHVVTIKKNMTPIDHSLTADIPDSASVYEVFSAEPGNMRAISRKKYQAKHIGKIHYYLLQGLIKVFSIIYYRIVIIDWHDGWVPFGLVKALQIVKKEKIDVIFVDMEPPSSSVIGILLKKITQKPLMIDYHDPWTTAVDAKRTGGIKKKIADFLEGRILGSADKVTAGKTNIISEIADKFSEIDHRKLHTIFSGYDPDDFNGLERKKDSKFVVTYTGKVTEKHYYSPESFLYAIGELIAEKKIPEDDIKALFVGSISDRYRHRFQRLIAELDLHRVVINTGSVEHRACMAYQLNADVLLYIIESLEGKQRSYEFSGVLPSKLYEYFYTGNPILAIVPPGFEADLIERTRTGLVAEPNNVASVKSALYDLYLRHKDGMLTMDPDQDAVGRFHRKHLTGELAALMDELLP